jgi:hypothetical protein
MMLTDREQTFALIGVIIGFALNVFVLFIIQEVL